jgi:hypothetical protein
LPDILEAKVRLERIDEKPADNVNTETPAVERELELGELGSERPTDKASKLIVTGTSPDI